MEERQHKKGWVEQNKKLARERALVILQVRSGALTAKEGAKLLGVSRKTYYEWEEKSLRAMALALEKKLDLAEKTIEVKELLGAYEEFRGRGNKKNR